MTPRRIGLGAALLALIAALCLLVPRLEMGLERPAVPAAQPRLPAPATPPASQPVSVRIPDGNAEEPSRLADGLNSPTGDVHSDLRLVNEIFVAYRAATHSGNPVGENAEISAALMGRNRLGFAFIPKDCPAINSKGELCDRWGTPYFFHQISGEQMEIRSAGPDHELWTADDQILTP